MLIAVYPRYLFYDIRGLIDIVSEMGYCDKETNLILLFDVKVY